MKQLFHAFLVPNATDIIRVVRPPAALTGQAEPDPRPFSRLARPGVWLLVAVLGLGGILRFTHIGKFGFWTDELFHVFAARSWLSDGTLDVPMTGEYTRALPVTYMTAVAFRFWGESEMAARLPFAAVNLLFIGTAFLLLRRQLSDRLALLFAVVMSLSPFAIQMSRECRMYTLFQFLYFGMALAFFAGFEAKTSPTPTGRSRTAGPIRALEDRFGIRLLFLALSAALAAAALAVHLLTVNFVFVVAAYCGVMAAASGVGLARPRIIGVKYAAVLGIFAVGFGLLLALRPDAWRALVDRATEVPAWATAAAANRSYYRYFLSSNFPALFFLYPLGSFWLIRRYGRRGLFLCLSFAVLYLLHSYVFGRKNDRYIFYIDPFFVIGAVAAVDWLLDLVTPALRRSFLDQPRWARLILAAFLLPALNVLMYPWLGNADNIPFISKYSDWKSFPADLKHDIKRGTVLTTSPRSYVYYFNAVPAYYILYEADGRTYAHGDRLVRPADVRLLVDAVPDLVIVTDRWNFHNAAYFDEAARQKVLSRMEAVKHTGDARLMVFRRPAPGGGHGR